MRGRSWFLDASRRGPARVRAFHFPIEVKTKLAPKGPANFDVQQRFDLGFARYKVYLYNSTDRTVDANVYLYLTQ